ncbi:serine/threonine dehydratase [Edaphobacter acidisoli]|uniref:Serine/threonine dehydratase n=1 Tax=Edaphobacter acidisoli TaxID=2040573 RepID=A0A916RRX5_9BACT|nr:threonine/serine dehydratase [Edaphobacter acidisoli]GGA66540.1 serine/threonine dehydratase [Edaphobacter acidisoli]
MDKLVTLEEIRAAEKRIAGVVVRTPLYRVSRARLRMAKAVEPEFDLYIKAESEQPIGSFKLRGAYNMMARLTPEALRLGVITYSSGNHAQGVAYAARGLGTKAVIVMPENAPAVKKAATTSLGAEIVEVGPASSERRAKAEELAAKFGYTIIPPYDDAAIIAGQATCGLEIVEQLPGVGLVIAPVSGGGLLSGVATAIKLAAPHVKVWGAEPELAADAKESFESKKLAEWPASKTTRTICDGLRTQTLGTLNFKHILSYVDGVTAVAEDEILAAIRTMLQVTSLVPEPSGAVSLAAALFHADELPKANKVVVVLSGGNLEPELRKSLEDKSAAHPHH